MDPDGAVLVWDINTGNGIGPPKPVDGDGPQRLCIQRGEKTLGFRYPEWPGRGLRL
jgi:hypothetical protein